MACEHLPDLLAAGHDIPHPGRQDTVDQLQAVLDNPAFKNWYFYYQASW